MSSNRIFASKTVGSTIINGKPVALAVATHTETWRRPEWIALAQAPGFTKAVDRHTSPIPQTTAKIVLRENQHSSPGDHKTHYTGVLQDAMDNYLASVHFNKPTS